MGVVFINSRGGLTLAPDLRPDDLFDCIDGRRSLSINSGGRWSSTLLCAAYPNVSVSRGKKKKQKKKKNSAFCCCSL
jgi:hypothetical protein